MLCDGCEHSLRVFSSENQNQDSVQELHDVTLTEVGWWGSFNEKTLESPQSLVLKNGSIQPTQNLSYERV